MLLCGCANSTSQTTTAPVTAAADTSAAETTSASPENTVNYGEMRDISVDALIGEMKTGWNLGNTLDALGGETNWGNPKTTHEMIDTVAQAGFNVIRIPTTWGENIDDADGYKISDEWMDRVHEVVDYAFDNGMYVILNSHHETSWIVPATDKLDTVKPKFTAMWKQIAESFEPYGDHLLFEGLNEPRIEGGENEWNGGTDDGRAALNELNKAFVETVRATGGNNEKRVLLVTTFAAAVVNRAFKGFEMPDDDRTILSLHAYTPYAYTYHSGADWEIYEFGDNVASEIDNVFGFIDKHCIDKGIHVIITEYGSVRKTVPGSSEYNDAENEKWVKYYLTRAKQSGIPCVIWDNGVYSGSGGRIQVDGPKGGNKNDECRRQIERRKNRYRVRNINVGRNGGGKPRNGFQHVRYPWNGTRNDSDRYSNTRGHQVGGHQF